MKLQNPIGITNIGDPFVIKHEDTYYLYATSFFPGFYVWTSKDLIHFEGPFKAYEQGPRSFGYKDYWAPEVVYHQGIFVMHYSARQKGSDSLRIGVATSKSPLGPFVDVYDQKPMIDEGYACIDGHVFLEEDKAYFYFDKDCSEHVFEGRNESHIYVALLNEDLTKLIEKPKLVLRPSQAWEKVTGDWRWNEGPYVLKEDGVYYLMYSSGFYASKSYSIGYATSNSPFGPFTKAEENPILKSSDTVSGPGHNSVITAPDGKRLCVYHVHTDYDNPSENRQVFMDELKIIDGKLQITGPTIGDQNDQ